MASFLSRLNSRPDGYGGAREHRVRLPLEVLAAVRAARRRRLRRRHPLSRRRGRRRAAAISTTRSGSACASREAGVDYLSVSKGGRVRGRQAAEGRRGRLSLHRRVAATSACRRCYPTRAARSAATCRWPRRSAGRSTRPAGSTPVVTSGGITTFEQAESILARGEADCVAAARQTPRRSRLVQEDPPRPRWARASLRVHELLRGPRPASQAGHVQALGSPVRSGRPAVTLASDGKRRLSAPAWSPPGDAPDRLSGAPTPSEAGAPETFTDDLVVRPEPVRALKCGSRVGLLAELQVAPAHSGQKRLGSRCGEARPDEHRQGFSITARRSTGSTRSCRVRSSPLEAPGRQTPVSVERPLERRKRRLVIAALEQSRSEPVQAST